MMQPSWLSVYAQNVSIAQTLDISECDATAMGMGGHKWMLKMQISLCFLVAVETDESIFLLATCYYRSNQIHQAYWLLNTKEIKSPKCRFLLAKCAYDLKRCVTIVHCLCGAVTIDSIQCTCVATDFFSAFIV